MLCKTSGKLCRSQGMKFPSFGGYNSTRNRAVLLEAKVEVIRFLFFFEVKRVNVQVIMQCLLLRNICSVEKKTKQKKTRTKKRNVTQNLSSSK